MKLFVGSLARQCTEEDLKEIFSNHGEVSSVKIITDRDTNQSRGFGFVEMPNDGEAQEAMEQLNGKEFQGRALVVNEAREQKNKAPFKKKFHSSR